MNTIEQISGYKYANADSNDAHSFLLPEVLKILSGLRKRTNARLFDLGCGNGAVAHRLSMEGWFVQGVDRQTRYTLHRTLGSWPYQVLVEKHIATTAEGYWVQDGGVSACRSHSLFG